MTDKINRLGIVGVGLIGGSLALALKEADSVNAIVGFGRNEQRLAGARAAGIIDGYDESLSGVSSCDVVIVCTPVCSMKSIFSQIAPHLSPKTIVTDAGSVKGNVVVDAKDTLGENFANFVPGHPIAGTEKSGYEAAFSSLYNDRRVILTPTEETNIGATKVIANMWADTGAEVVEMDVARHDQVLAATSHLPHLLAFGLVDSLAKLDEHDAIFRFAAGGFRDFTRIASSDVQMWRDICLSNKGALIDVLDTFQSDMNALRQALVDGNKEYIEDVFGNAHSARSEYLANYEPKSKKK